jgi:hypothetical protein
MEKKTMSPRTLEVDFDVETVARQLLNGELPVAEVAVVPSFQVVPDVSEAEEPATAYSDN